jgi:hypothetical protein
MTSLYDKVPDIEFMIMGIGDMAYDNAPVQASQFESDIRIAQHLDKIYFESGGGGNGFESYTAAWYFGTYHCKLDCWERGQKGLIITMGDEYLNPCLSVPEIERFIGTNKISSEILNQIEGMRASVETTGLYKEASKKYDIYHIDVNHNRWSQEDNTESFAEIIGKDHVFEATVNAISNTIIDIIMKKYDESGSFVSPIVGDEIVETSANDNLTRDENNEISW